MLTRKNLMCDMHRLFHRLSSHHMCYPPTLFVWSAECEFNPTAIHCLSSPPTIYQSRSICTQQTHTFTYTHAHLQSFPLQCISLLNNVVHQMEIGYSISDPYTACTVSFSPSEESISFLCSDFHSSTHNLTVLSSTTILSYSLIPFPYTKSKLI